MRPRLDRIVGHPATLAVGWAAAVVSVAAFADHYWIPLDDGTLAQSAERVLGGQLPHRDFGDPYTGLNAVVGALAFRLLGVSLPSLRVPLVLGFAAWLPSVWLVARRFAPPVPAAAATVLAATASVLTYPAAMPTWFGLFLTTWGLWFLLRFLEAGDRRWLVGVGLTAGVSILFKVTGLYFVAATLLTLAWHRAEAPAGTAAEGTDRPERGWSTWRIPLYPPVVAAGVAAFLILLARLVLFQAGPAGLVHFLLPGVVLGGGVVARSWRAAARPPHPPSSGPLGARIPALLGDGLVLGGALLMPVLVFLLPYAASDTPLEAVGRWVSGVFLLPGERFRFAASPAGPLHTVLPGLAGVGLLWASGHVRGLDRSRLAAALAVALLAAVALDDVLEGGVFATLWYAARSWTPWLVAWGVVAALRSRGDGAALFAVVATAGLWGLVQFPWVSPAYFFYLAPLAVLATLAVCARTPVGHGPVPGVLAALFLLMSGGYVAGVLAAGAVPLPGERGGILVPIEDARTYGALTEVVRDRLDGAGLWATPDAPEVYFLTATPNPTPVLYEFLGSPGAPGTPPGGALPPAGTGVVVLNTRPLFSPFPTGLEERLHRGGFTGRRPVGPFLVLWREAP